MAFAEVKAYFKKYDLANRIQKFKVSSATVELAAQALGCKPCQIAKTLSFKIKEEPILIVTSGDAKIANSKYKVQFGVKAKMLTSEETKTMIGYTIGGVCPFVISKEIKVYLDYSLKRFSTVFLACGSSDSIIELTIAELQQHSSFVAWVDVCQGWERIASKNEKVV